MPEKNDQPEPQPEEGKDEPARAETGGPVEDEEWKEQVREEQERMRQQEEKPGHAEEPPLPPPNLITFVAGLSTQVLCALGRIEHPLTGKQEVNLREAKYTIDVLAMLQEKTKGNLSDQESAFLENNLFELRMLYVQQTRSEGSEQSEE